MNKKLKNSEEKMTLVLMVRHMSRTEQKQLDHDKCVESKAIEWKNDGYIVFADLEGWDKPVEVEGYVPDILARKKGVARICEVETEDTLEDHRPKWESFKKFAEGIKGTSFWLFLAKEGGKCKYIEPS